jgi:hypothetical protein
VGAAAGRVVVIKGDQRSGAILGAPSPIEVGVVSEGQSDSSSLSAGALSLHSSCAKS